MAQHGHLTRKEKKEIRIKRRLLKKDLKRRKIYTRKEFEIIAQQMGLTYGTQSVLMGPFLWLLDTIGGTALGWAVAALAAAMLLTYGYAKMTKEKDDYTITLSGDLARIGFDLSETEDFKNPQVRLTAQKLEKANAMSIQDLPEDLDQSEGNHSGENYFAYTFWIRNHGQETVDYDWHVVLNSVTKNLDEALWIMIYDEGKQVVYARAPEGMKSEHLSGYKTYPHYDTAADPDTQYYVSAGGKKGISTTPYVEDREVARGTVKTFEPEEKHKYTFVMWVEGDDPECTNDRIGGDVSYAFKFAVAGDEKGIFDDIKYEEEDYGEDVSNRLNENPILNRLKGILGRD